MLWKNMMERLAYAGNHCQSDIDSLAEKEQEIDALVESLDKTCTRNIMVIPFETYFNFLT